MQRRRAPSKKQPASKRRAAGESATPQRAAPQRATPKRAAPKRAPKSAPPQRAPKSAAKKSAVVPVLRKLPWIWSYRTGHQCVGLWVDEQFVWASNDAGDVVALTHDGEVHKQMTLPHESVAAVADEAWKYAGCADGKVYDLTGRVPRAVYEVGKANIGWLEVHRGNLALADMKGAVAVYDAFGELRWKKTVKGGGEGWVCRTDGTGIYHGSEVGMRKLSWDGELLWHNATIGDVRFAVLAGDALWVTAGFMKTREAKLWVIDTATGETKLRRELTSRLPGFHQSGAEGCAVQTGATAAETRCYVGVGGVLHAFDGEGTKLWEASMGNDNTCNMMLAHGALFFSTHLGDVRRLDVSPAAIERALAGSVVKERKVERVAAAKDDGHVEEVASAGAGVVVEVVRVGSELRVRPASEGYRRDWFCQFPRELRIDGARFVVDELREASQGGFYRALGDIKRLRS